MCVQYSSSETHYDSYVSSSLLCSSWAYNTCDTPDMAPLAPIGLPLALQCLSMNFSVNNEV